MAKSNKLKCVSCDEVFTKEQIDGGFIFYDEDNKPHCESCEQNAWQYANTVIVAQNGEIKKYYYASPFGFRDEYHEELYERDFPGKHPPGIIKWEYHRTDGWRGYNAPVLEEGYVTIMDGWITGDYSDVPWKHKFSEFGQKLLSGDVECPYMVIFAIGLTSNVFSQTMDVILKASEQEGFERWIADELGFDVEELKRALV